MLGVFLKDLRLSQGVRCDGDITPASPYAAHASACLRPSRIRVFMQAHRVRCAPAGPERIGPNSPAIPLRHSAKLCAGRPAARKRIVCCCRSWRPSKAEIEQRAMTGRGHFLRPPFALGHTTLRLGRDPVNRDVNGPEAPWWTPSSGQARMVNASLIAGR